MLQKIEQGTQHRGNFPHVTESTVENTGPHFFLREARAGDAAALSALAADTFALACPAGTPAAELASCIASQLQPEHFLQHMASVSKILLVVEQAGAIVGYSLGDRAPGPIGITEADGLAELTRCYVRPDLHGSGAAQRLLDAMLALLTGPVRLTVSIENLRALGFYWRNGFATVGTTTFKCGKELHQDVVMVRTDTPSARHA